MNTKAELKPIVGYDNYFATPCGKVFSGKANKFLSIHKMPDGYLRVSMKINGKSKGLLVHRAVALAFLEPDESKTQVNHIDGNRANNAVNNLEWCTPKENQQNALQRKSFRHRAIQKLDENKKLIEEFWSVADAARSISGSNYVAKINVLCNVAKKGCRAYGFYWRLVA